MIMRQSLEKKLIIENMQSPQSEHPQLLKTLILVSTPTKKSESQVRNGLENFIQKSKLQNQSTHFLMALLNRVQKLQKQIDELQFKGVQYPKEKKKLRRKAKDVPRMYQCNIGKCDKEYGSITSLKNHRKLKHGIRIIRNQLRNKENRENQGQI